jgi:hypothetical protein
MIGRRGSRKPQPLPSAITHSFLASLAPCSAAARLTGSSSLPDQSGGVLVEGELAFIASGNAGLQILPAQCENLTGVPQTDEAGPSGRSKDAEMVDKLRDAAAVLVGKYRQAVPESGGNVPSGTEVGGRRRSDGYGAGPPSPATQCCK